MKKLTQIGAYGLIEENGRVLLTKHSEGPYKGLLDLPGGDFVHGETARQCVERQIQKDSELNISELKLLDVLTDRISWSNNNNLEDLHMICILFNINAKIKKLKDSSLAWFDLKEISDNHLTPVAIKAINDLRK
ncbi:MAG: NUDIX domain-containing protein [Clostridia bacterium]|nr:NUDIX domain-containing protein [Clostridia bacterium]